MRRTRQLQRFRTMSAVFLAVFLVGICLAPAAMAAITRVQSTMGGTFMPVSNSFSLRILDTAPVDGNTLVAAISTRGASANQVSSITQTGATWSRVAQGTNANGTTTEIWYAPNVSGAGTDITVNLAADLSAAAVVAEYRGLMTPTSFDVGAGTSGNSNTASTGTTATTGQAGELWFGGIGLVGRNYRLSDPTNSFTTVATMASGSFPESANSSVYALEKIVSATGTASSGGAIMDWFGPIVSQWSGAIATFKASLIKATTVGTATADAQKRSTCISVSMPYTGDANDDNSYTVRYKLSTDASWTNWVVGAANSAPSYTTTISGLTPGASYDVECTYNDPDGVTGANPQTFTVQMPLIGVPDPWTSVSSTSPGNTGGTVAVSATVSAGTNRLLMVTACAAANSSATYLDITSVTYGASLYPVNLVGKTATTGLEICYLGYLKESELLAGSQPINVTYASKGDNVAGLYIKWGSYEGVDQITPIRSSNANHNAAGSVTFGAQIDYVSAGLTIYSAATNNWMANIYTPPDFTQIEKSWSSFSHASFIGATAAHATAGSYPANSAVSFSFAGSSSALVVASLIPHRQTPTLSVTNSGVPYNGSPQTAVVVGSVPGTVSNIRYDGSATAPTSVGTYAVTADFVPNDTVNYHSLVDAPAGNFAIAPPTTVSVDIASSPAGRTITVDGTDITTPQIFTWPIGSSHTIAVATSPQTSGGSRYTFASWADGGTATRTVTVTASPATYTANFTAEYQLTTAVNPAGAGSVSPVTGTWYAANSTVPVKGFPSGGYGFVTWSGPVASATAAATSVTMTSPQTVTMNATPAPALTAAITGKTGADSARI